MLASEHRLRMPDKEEGGYALAVKLTPMSMTANGDRRTAAPALLGSAVAVVKPMD